MLARLDLFNRLSVHSKRKQMHLRNSETNWSSGFIMRLVNEPRAQLCLSSFSRRYVSPAVHTLPAWG
jgi:hypothetical protein